ncbi:MAG: hypothetical protein U5L09_15520 [Bacteroidales bacterium]|nr:hypothetical protein [Bacteroidales bacterium]
MRDDKKDQQSGIISPDTYRIDIKMQKKQYIKNVVFGAEAKAITRPFKTTKRGTHFLR